MTMVDVNNNDGFFKPLSGGMWDGNGKSVRALIAQSGERVPNCIWEVKETKNEDGTVDKTYLEKDSKGRVIREIFDKGGDDIIDRVTTREYDERDNITRNAVDEDGDGKDDRVETREYDDRDHITRYAVDEDGDGKDDRVETWEYDERDNNTRYAIDEDGDGKDDCVETCEYDERDNITKQVTMWEGEVVEEVNYQYDKKNRLVREEKKLKDSNFHSVKMFSNGKLVKYSAEYFEDGSRIVETDVYSSNGIINSTEKYDYDRDGAWDSIRKSKTQRIDNGADLEDDYILLEEDERNFNADRPHYKPSHSHMEFDPETGITKYREEYDDDNDSKPETIETRENYRNGRRKSYERAYFENGEQVYKVSESYNLAGKITQVVEDENGDNISDRVILTSYTEDGKPIETEIDPSKIKF